MYGMTKAAMEYQTRSLAAELAPLGIRVNAIAPGPVDTPIHLSWAGDDVAGAYERMRSEVTLETHGNCRRIGSLDCLAGRSRINLGYRSYNPCGWWADLFRVRCHGFPINNIDSEE